MTEYESGLPVLVAFRPGGGSVLAEAVCEAGWTQFHVAETEKYAHVTYFFNGGVETPWPGEERMLVPSPKVATYDLQPEMSARRRHRRARRGHRVGDVRLHRGQLRQPRHGRPHRRLGRHGQASDVIDGCLGRVADAVAAVEAADPCGRVRSCSITADHGNADEMRDEGRSPVTEHSLNPVPFLLVGPGAWRAAGFGTACSPTSRRRCWSSRVSRRWPGMTGRSLLGR